MAPIVLLDVKLTINAVNMSTFSTSATASFDVDDQETTAFGSTWKSRVGGLKDGKIEMEFNQSYAASEVDATIWPLLGTVVAFTAKPSSGTTTATNPEYQGNVLISEYTPLDGGVGDLGKLKVSWPTSGAVIRATS